MARRSSSQPMAIWTNGELVGHWTPAMRRPMELRYEDSWLASRSARPLSLSLPLPLVGNEPLRGDRVEYFFDNLLPDSATIRRRLAQRYSAGSEDTFDLLSAIGRDCVGAVQLLPVDEAPTGFLELAAPDRWAAVRGAFGEELARRVERDLTIAWIDALWSDHLENVAELREGISLRTLGGQDPLGEYQRALVALFADLLRELDARVAGTFETAEITADGVDLGREGLASPSSTWTYLVNDQPFGSMLERMARNLVRFAKV